MFARSRIVQASRSLAQTSFMARAMPFSMQMTMGMPMRAFSSQEIIEQSKNKLIKVLDKELKFENEQYSQLEDIENYLQESGYAFKEQDDKIQMNLSQQFGDQTVYIHFDSRQPMPSDDSLTEDNNQMQEEDQQVGMNDENYCDFTVFISNKGGQGVVAECTTMDTEIQINNVMVSDDIEKIRGMNRFERTFMFYPGPEFSTLDERLQTSVIEYFEGFGINEHMAAFIECMSIDKDQRLYMNWLQDLRSFVSE